MNLAAPFIRRPVMTTLTMLGLAMFGILAYRQLPVSDLPNVDYPTIEVSAALRGGTPETMAASVATPLEKEFSTIAGVDSMNSSSAQGSSQITLQFVLSRDLDAAALDVQAAISRAMRNLPPQMDTPPSYRKVNPADQPILFLALTSPTLPLYELDEYAQTFLAQRISMVAGVAQVMVYGSQKFAVRVQLNPHELAVRGIGLDEVAGAIQSGNVNLPTGILYGPERAFAVQADGQLARAKDFRSLIVAYRKGAPVRLGDLGSVLDSVENNKVAAWYCTSNLVQRSIVLAVQRQPGKNTVEVAADVRKLLVKLGADMPKAISMEVLIDASQSIKASYEDVKFTLFLTLLLVVLVIFIFLRNASATLIPSLALPMSMVGTFVVMAALNYSLDNLSLMALTLALGFVVDDAIVVLENIIRHREMGKDGFTAALDGTREISFTIVSMTVSLTAVFIPVLFMGGVVGRLFREFAVTIGAAVLVSGVVALTLIPMLSARFVGEPVHGGHGRLYRFMEAGFDGMLRFYASSLRWALDHRRGMMGLALVTLLATGYLFWAVPKGFMASEDRGRININTEAIEGISFDSMVVHQNRMIGILQADPNIQGFMSSVGARGSSGGNAGRFIVSLKPREERRMTTDQVVQSLRAKLSGVIGVRAFPVNPPLINIGGRSSKSQYQYTLSGTDTAELYRSAEALVERLRDLGSLQDVSSDLQLKNPELNVEINRDLASSLQVTAGQIETALFNAYGSRQVSSILTPNNQYAVILEMQPRYQADPSVLSWLHIRGGDGRLVPLEAVARLKRDVGPVTVNHSGQLPSVTITFDLRPGVSLGAAVDQVDAVAREVLSPQISTMFQGAAQVFQSSFKGLGWLLALAVLVIYIVLGILYEDFLHPVTILSALPFAGVGALVTLMLFGSELSIYAFVGIIMLVGLVKKNGIIMIDFAIAARRDQGKSARDAIYEACLVRFRPIMMTTMAALAAAVPIAVGYGAGGEARRPLGLTVVGGLVFSQTLTLYVTPVFYLYMEKVKEALRKRRGK
jgi:HAE1 family hydrophobic/amphiphilic exporter-1